MKSSQLQENLTTLHPKGKDERVKYFQGLWMFIFFLNHSPIAIPIKKQNAKNKDRLTAA